MKKFIPAFLALIFILTLSSCRRTSHNGDLDGFWRIDRIEFADPEPGQDNTVVPDQLFIAINLELMQLYNPSLVATGVINYDEDQATLGVEFPYKPSLQTLIKFGITDNPVTFKVEDVSGKRLVLKSDDTRIICTRF